jgi:hypothetical protein
VAKAGSIKLVDRKSADATMAASGAADKPLSTLTSRVNQGRVNDLNERPISRRWSRTVHVGSINLGHGLRGYAKKIRKIGQNPSLAFSGSDIKLWSHVANFFYTENSEIVSERK